MKRLFKPGDRVQLKTGGPVMEVMKYVTKESPVLGVYESNHQVECVWFDPKEGRKTAVFHQNSLEKTSWVKSKNVILNHHMENPALSRPADTLHQVTTLEAVYTADTLADAIALLKRQGYHHEFVALAEGLRDLESKKVYPPQSVSIEQVLRFEGYTDIDDMSILYAIVCEDGTRGWIADAYGTYANPYLSALLVRMKDERKQWQQQQVV